MRRLLLALVIFAPIGCASYPRAQNPLPGVFRVAVIPFTNKTGGSPGVDLVRITNTFASELQKVPTFEVVPVWEVREVLGHRTIDTNQPELAFAIARAVHAQAVIVGSVVEYDPYYPPRLGLHCEMYAMVTGEPEIVLQNIPEPLPTPRQRLAAPMGKLLDLCRPKHRCCCKCKKHFPLFCKNKCCPDCGEPLSLLIGSADALEQAVGPGELFPSGPTPAAPSAEPIETVPPEQGPKESQPIDPQPAIKPVVFKVYTPAELPKGGITADLASSASPQQKKSEKTGSTLLTVQGAIPNSADDAILEEERDAAQLARPLASVFDLEAERIPAYQITTERLPNPIPIVEPWVIRHSRIFDGTNLGLIRKLKDYYFFKDDLRGVEWKGYVERMHDFERFSCNLMIYEMLEAAGGRWVILRGIRLPKPWEPWPWK